MSDTPLETKRIPEHELQQMFNEGDYAGRLRRNELTAHLLKDGPAPLRDDLPPGSRSQMVVYRDTQTRKVVAEVHQYMRPNGTLGASGKQDPKRIFVGNIAYIPIPRQPKPS